MGHWVVLSETIREAPGEQVRTPAATGVLHFMGLHRQGLPLHGVFEDGFDHVVHGAVLLLGKDLDLTHDFFVKPECLALLGRRRSLGGSGS